MPILEITSMKLPKISQGKCSMVYDDRYEIDGSSVPY